MPVRYEIPEPGICYVTLDAPESRNALGDVLLDADRRAGAGGGR